MTPYVLSLAAARDLEDIADRVSEDNGVAVALRIAEELDQKLRLIAHMPGMGRPRPEFIEDPNIWFMPFYSWLIVYDPHNTPLQVIRILSAARNIPDILGSDP